MGLLLAKGARDSPRAAVVLDEALLRRPALVPDGDPLAHRLCKGTVSCLPPTMYGKMDEASDQAHLRKPRQLWGVAAEGQSLNRAKAPGQT